MIQYRHIIFTFFIFIALGFSMWIYIHSEENIQSHTSLNTNQVDAFAEGISVQRFNQQGELMSTLETAQLTHFFQNDVSQFITPHVTIFQKQQTPWKIKSDRGEAIHGDKEITFFDNVQLTQAATSTTSATDIRTTRLTYFPHKKYATTQQFITMTQSGLTIQSVGMHAYLDQERVELLSKAQGLYTTHSSNASIGG